MKVAIVSCEECDDEWHVRDPDGVRDVCRTCGSDLDVEIREEADAGAEVSGRAQ